MNNSISNIVTVIQARANSTRLPQKVLLSLASKPLLFRLYERVKKSSLTGTIVIATTTDPSDDVIAKLCEKEKINFYRGHPTDLLDRHYKVGLKYDADIIVKIPSDCPLIDPKVISRIIKYYLDNQDKYDYVSNLHPATFPDGNDVEVITMPALKKAWKNASHGFEREHTTPYIWENPDLFRIGNVTWETRLNFSMSHRWTIDYEEDYCFIKKVYDDLYSQNPFFGLEDILSLVENDNYLKTINQKFNGVNWYRNHLHELKTITHKQTKVL